MIDLHCHVLWGMDDGAKSFEETESLCKTALENNLDTLILTPHMTDLDRLDDFLFCRDENTKELRNALEALRIPLQIYTGAEVYLNDKIFSAEGLHDLTLNRSRYFLCEFSIPEFSPRRGLSYVEEVLEHGLVPIIAHPERYETTYKHPHFLEELSDMGVLMQVNAPSLAGKFGPEVQACALELLLSGTADFIATDAHRPHWRPNNLLDHIEDFPKEITPELLSWATSKAPKLVLEDKDVFAAKQDV